MRRRALLLLGVLATGCVTPLGPEDLQPGMTLRGKLRLRPGTYSLPGDEEGALILEAGTSLDLRGVTLVGSPEGTAPDAFQGTAIRVFNAEGVSIRGGAFRGYKVAVWATRADGLAVTDCDFSGNFRQRLGSTPLKEDEQDWMWPHFNEENEWAENYGAGLYVEDSRQVDILDNFARDGQNGIVLDGVSECHVFNNDCSFMSGWGLALYRSSGNFILWNHFDFCVRGYSHGVYQRGQDSAGILLFEQCSRNWIAANSATYGGDGLFLYAGEESLKKTGRGGSNDNVVMNNDFSHAVANGIEATFSSGNFFAANRLHDCNYGVWAGYSSRSWFVNNSIAGSRYAGVAIEHGRHNLVQGNCFREDEVGVSLWWDPDEGLADTVWGRKNDLRSHGNWIEDNEFTACGEKVRLVETTPPSGPAPQWSLRDFLPGPPMDLEPPSAGSSGPLQRSMQRIQIGEWGPLPAEPEYSRAGAVRAGRSEKRVRTAR